MAFTFLLLTIFLQLVCSLVKGDIPKCHNLPPGLIRMSFGVDITSLDLFPVLPKDENKNNGFRNQLFTFTCENNVTWNFFQIPDQIDSKNGIQQIGASHVNSAFYQDLKEYKVDLISQVGLDVHIERKNAFSSSGRYFEASKQFMNFGSVVEISSYSSAIKLNATLNAAKRQLSDHFVSAINNLTLESIVSYLKIIEEFGTHFFDVATLATGVIYQSSKIDKAYHGDESQALTNAMEKFSNTRNFTIDKNFESNTVTHLYHYQDAGHIFEGHLVPIEHLIQLIDNQKAQKMKEISAYYVGMG